MTGGRSACHLWARGEAGQGVLRCSGTGRVPAQSHRSVSVVGCVRQDVSGLAVSPWKLTSTCACVRKEAGGAWSSASRCGSAARPPPTWRRCLAWTALPSSAYELGRSSTGKRPLKAGSDQGFRVREGLRSSPHSSLVSTLSYGLVQNKSVPVQAHLQPG